MQGMAGASTHYRTGSLPQQQTMMEREPLRVKLSDQERGFYSNMYAQVNPEQKRELES